MEYKILCETLDQDFHEIGLSIGFSAKDKEFLRPDESDISKILDGIGDYITINITFGEDDDLGEYEDDYPYIDSNVADFYGDLNEFKIIFNENRILILKESDSLEVSYSISSKTFAELKVNMEIIDPEKKYINLG
jgi:hypothetical protein